VSTGPGDRAGRPGHAVGLRALDMADAVGCVVIGERPARARAVGSSSACQTSSVPMGHSSSTGSAGRRVGVAQIPAGSAAAQRPFMVSLNCCDADWPVLSVTFMVNLKVPAAVGVPASWLLLSAGAPVDVSARPGGVAPSPPTRCRAPRRRPRRSSAHMPHRPCPAAGWIRCAGLSRCLLVTVSRGAVRLPGRAGFGSRARPRCIGAGRQEHVLPGVAEAVRGWRLAWRTLSRWPVRFIAAGQPKPGVAEQ
jgi:hypothetical protein